jgi:hypothetical protein
VLLSWLRLRLPEKSLFATCVETASAQDTQSSAQVFNAAAGELWQMVDGPLSGLATTSSAVETALAQDTSLATVPTAARFEIASALDSVSATSVWAAVIYEVTFSSSVETGSGSLLGVCTENVFAVETLAGVTTGSALPVGIVETANAVDVSAGAYSSLGNVSEVITLIVSTSFAGAQLAVVQAEVAAAVAVSAAGSIVAVTHTDSMLPIDVLGLTGNAYQVEVSESAVGTDTSSRILSALGVAAETALGIEASSALAVRSASVIETVAAVDSVVFSSQTLFSTALEAANATDVANSVVISFNVVVAESAVAQDQVSASKISAAVVAESTSATDLSSATGSVSTLAVVNTLVAIDATDAVLIDLSDGVVEVANAQSQSGAALVYAVAQVEVASAQEAIAYGTQLFFISVAEFGVAVELLNAGSVRGAAVAEVGSSIDLVSISDGQFFGAVAELGNVQDSVASGGMLGVSVVEMCFARDQVMQAVGFNTAGQVWVRTAVSAPKDLWYRNPASDEVVVQVKVA